MSVVPINSYLSGQGTARINIARDSSELEIRGQAATAALTLAVVDTTGHPPLEMTSDVLTLTLSPSARSLLASQTRKQWVAFRTEATCVMCRILTN